MNASEVYKWENSLDEWILLVDSINSDQFVCTSSSGKVIIYLMEKLRLEPVSQISAHECSINDTTVVKSGEFGSSGALGTCSTDGIKIWDLRTNQVVNSFTNEKKSTFLSIDSLDTYVCGGTELIGNDAEVHLWDLRNPKCAVKSYKDSHHDDVTHLQLHPTYSQYLMSGSTDGYVNIYNLKEADEDDALHQVINYASVHSCRFISNDRIGILSHMETLSFHQLNNTDYESAQEPLPTDLNDVRTRWENCEYVVDLNPQGYISYGANSAKSLSLLPFDPIAESFGSNAILFPSAHGEEVVRDLKVLEKNNATALSAGEDGIVRLWRLPEPVPLYDVFGLGRIQSRDSLTLSTEEPDSNKTKQHKHNDKHRHKHKHRHSKIKSKARYKPY